MKKLNRKGFTLIELLAVITIMGILMLVAIPAVSRTIENSRRDTFADVAKTYVNTVRNAVLADELKCGDDSVGAVGDGVYFFKINTKSGTTEYQQTIDIMESGGLSSWSSANVEGYVKWLKKTQVGSTPGADENAPSTPNGVEKVTTTYSILLVDTGSHGIATELAETEISRAKVSTRTAMKAGGEGEAAITYPTGTETIDGTTYNVTECTLK